MNRYVLFLDYELIKMIGYKTKTNTIKKHKVNRIFIHDLIGNHSFCSLREIKQPRGSVVGFKANARSQRRDI